MNVHIKVYAINSRINRLAAIVLISVYLKELLEQRGISGDDK
jgi:hypothetical protein